MNKPYVISCELELAGDSIRQPGLTTFRENLDADLRAMGKKTLWVETDRIKSGLDNLITASKQPVISLDTRYVTGAAAYLGLSRSVNPDISDAGYDARIGFKELTQQLDTLGRTFAGQEVAIADDVLFSGEMLSYLQQAFAERNVAIGSLLCGIAIGEGAEKLAERGIATESVLYFGDVEDELCERDFTLLYGSGRKIKDEQRAAVYFDPEFGRPDSWASIPTSEMGGFCVRNLARNLALLKPNLPAPAFLGYPSGTNREVAECRMARTKRLGGSCA